MKRNSIIIVVIVVLMIAAAMLYLTNRSGTFSDSVKAFAIEDTASVTKIFLADKKNRTILLEEQPDGNWMLNNKFLARKSGVDLLLETMKNLVPKYPVPQKAHNSIVAQMSAQAIKVEIYQEVYRVRLTEKLKWFPHEKLTKTYYVGGATADNMGTFMLMEGAEMPFVVHLLGFRGFVRPRYTTIEKNWRDHTVFKTRLFEIESVELEIPGDPANSFKVKNENDEVSLFQLKTGEPVNGFDTLKVYNFLSSFADLRFEALVDNMEAEEKDSIINFFQKDIITLTDVHGKKTKVKTFYMPNYSGTVDPVGKPYDYDVDRMYALVNDDKDFVLIQYFVFDKILKPLQYFRP